jgi:2'-5' RNA ligase
MTDRTLHYNYFVGEDDDTRPNRFAVVAFLPQELDAMIAPLREKYDPIYNLIGSHITIVFPFESERTVEELTGIVSSETSGRTAVPVELSSIGDFYPQTPVIYWAVKANPALNELYYGLYSRLGLPLSQKLYLPHVTVAREISPHRVWPVKDNIISYLPDESFLVKSLDLVTLLPRHNWVSVRTFPLQE